MKSNAPWSVKGIEKDAREAAKAAAQREGMTVGEWLNQIIYTAGDPDAPQTAGEIEGLKARDLAAAIEHLSRRISAAESKSAQAVDNLARSLGGAVERLQRMERADPSERAADEALAARVRILEEKSTDRQRIEALRALERAVGQIAVQFSHSEKSTVSRLDAAERQLQEIAARIEQGAGDEAVGANAVREAIEGMAARISRAEKIAAEASQMKAEAAESVDADFIHKTGLRLRILGDEIKRGGDQMRTLETTIARLSQQIDAAEKRSAEGVQKVAETIADLKSQFASADQGDHAAARAEIEAAVSEIAQRTEDRIETLQQSFDDMVRRLESATGRVTAPAPAVPAAAAPAPQASTSAPQASTPAPQASIPAPQASIPAPLEDIDDELEEAFAALELEEPIPTPTIEHETSAPVVEDEDDFGFDADEPEAAGAFEDREPEASEIGGDDHETLDVLAEIREAFGIDAPARADFEEEEEGGDDPAADDAADFAVEPPPVAIERPDSVGVPPQSQADYLRAARQAARDAAARAAADASAPRRKKLTPKQRAILAARIKRRKQLAEAHRPGDLAAPAPVETPDADDVEQKASIKARVTSLLARLKNRSEKKEADEDKAERKPASHSPSAHGDDEESPAAKGPPNILAALGKFRSVTEIGGVIGLVVAITLAGAAAFFFFKDTRGAKTTGPAAKIDAPAPAAGDPQASERTAPAASSDPLVRPRDLYLDNIVALKNATTDQEARDALKRIEQAAALGHPPAQLQIGELYKLGQLYDRDLVEARMWFERAANGGNILAMHRLGVMAARGEGGPIDPGASISWFEKAANFGLVDSQYNLGATYHPTPDGAAAGVQDRARAYFWYSIAARNGDAQAGEVARNLGSTMPANERAAADAEAAAWAPKTPDPAANELAPAQ